MTKRILTATVLTIAAIMQVDAVVPDDNVVISEGKESYRFVQVKGGFEVVHTVADEYLATRRSEKIQPHIFHGNNIRLDKASGGKPQYRNANSPTVFHDDSKVCFFEFFLSSNKKAKAQFRRTFTDPAYFTGIFPLDEYPIRNKTISVDIPASLPGIELLDCNFPAEGIVRSDTKAPDGSRRITYTLTDVGPAADDKSAPSPKASLPYIMVKGYFPDTDSLYRYHRRLLDVDTVIPDVSGIVRNILGDTKDRDKVIERLYRYVQNNVRYVAFEEGEAGYRPDTPAEVLRKRYGDCKGMAMLLATLLNRNGIDAYVAIVGTRSIPYGIAENPSLSASNHMICIVPRKEGASLFLDPTNGQISMYHIPWGIRGKDAMMILPDGYEMVNIPEESPRMSDDVITYDYRLTSEGLAGKAVRSCREDMAERFVSIFNNVPSQHVNELLARMLVPASNMVACKDSIVYDTSVPGFVTLTAPVYNKSAITEASDAIYIDLNSSDGPFGERIDLDDRRADLEFYVPASVERRTVVEMPDGYSAVLPENYESECPYGRFSCTFACDGSTVSMTKRMEVVRTRIPLADIPEWNNHLSAWKEACSLQVELRKP
ncbi:transglutaminase-like domain-containing protein [Muribaculum intestinale]|uniref:transglutaminase-like domain-containing protein n=1 Tax=Muribaculum intestinale TaxID=1796646 RepID=UPI00242B0CE9|nr:transglutaminase domain-containing protein [Muribaculum intestinale]